MSSSIRIPHNLLAHAAQGDTTIDLPPGEYRLVQVPAVVEDPKEVRLRAIAGLPHNASRYAGHWYCAPTKVWVVAPAFLDVYLQLGDLAPAILGLPITQSEIGAATGDLVQYFEGCRMELRRDGSVAFGRLGTKLTSLCLAAGRELLASRHARAASPGSDLGDIVEDRSS